MSSVHNLPSSHTLAVPGLHDPNAHTSPLVHLLLSSQATVLSRFLHAPVTVSQLSSVHTLASLQDFNAPGLQAVAAQTSPWVQALPSSHGAALAWFLHAPLTVSQLSSVHTLLSLHDFAAPALQVPPAQPSISVQALPSVQGALLLAEVHAPVATLQPSSVQGLLSPHALAAPPLQALAAHASFNVHWLPSLQGAVLTAFAHLPSLRLQVSVVQTLLSSQLLAWPAAQPPPVHLSNSVQALPSSQPELLLTNWHLPSTWLQASLVQGFLSSQSTVAPALQVPLAQASPVVHALPSEQAPPVSGWLAHCSLSPACTHLSALHGLLSLQVSASFCGVQAQV